MHVCCSELWWLLAALQTYPPTCIHATWGVLLPTTSYPPHLHPRSFLALHPFPSLSLLGISYVMHLHCSIPPHDHATSVLFAVGIWLLLARHSSPLTRCWS